ncbi:unnamed protein product [Citrullus colocynthis]|uniref:Uncharacterized protein n=1 Tax=Citrullus colocynthis TaxID=252529 RepID=A0ABP0YP75_9ROSI
MAPSKFRPPGRNGAFPAIPTRLESLAKLAEQCRIFGLSYIVYLGLHSHGLNPSLLDLQHVTESHYDLLGSVLGSKEIAKEAIVYSYNRYINGFAAMLNEKQRQILQVFGQNLRASVTKDMGLSLQGGSAVVKVTLTPTFTATGQELQFVPYLYFLPLLYFNSSRDHHGHGTQTLSTAGGNFVSGANVFGNGNGTAKGGSPRARVASYKVCWPAEDGGCFDPDILAAFEAAISDGVDVISVSLGAIPTDFLNDRLSIGAFHAVQQGIVVVCSAGNSGPAPGSPWMLTVGASTIDRDFTNFVVLGNKKRFKGASLSSKALPVNKFYPLINAVDVKANNVTNRDA